MLDEDKYFREAKAMGARLVDNWLQRNRGAIVGGGLAHAVRIDLMNELTRTLDPLVRKVAGLAAAAAPPSEQDPAPAKAPPKARKMRPADMARLVPFKGKIVLPGETDGIAHPPAPKGGRKRKAAPVPDEDSPDAA